MDLDLDRVKLTEIEEIELDKNDLPPSNENKLKPFLSGVIEGFYGLPWSTSQRQHLLLTTENIGEDCMRLLNVVIFNIYVDNLSVIINCAKNCGINFVYSISPGLDISYSSVADRDALITKLRQVKSLGASSFGLFFDDIDPELDEQDYKIYNNYADAQAELANSVYEALGCPEIFFFCPTEYCSSRTKPSLFGSSYLCHIGETLNENIIVLWTGSRVIPLTIPLDHIKNVEIILKRKPLIWDNFFANDYDSHQVFLGPFQGRPLELCSHIQGILLNPNCQYDLNFVPIHTFSFWIKSAKSFVDDENCDVEALTDEYTVYRPEEAFTRACSMWFLEFCRNIPYTGQTQTRSDMIDLDSENTSSSDSNFTLNKISLTKNDLIRICSYMYLPCQLGPNAANIFSQFKKIQASSTHFWNNKSSCFTFSNDQLNSKRKKIKRACTKTLFALKRLRTSPNQLLLCVLFPFLEEIKETLENIRSFIIYFEIRERKPIVDAPFCDPDGLLNRGRFATEIQKLFPSFLFNESTEELSIRHPIYNIRPPNDSDRDRLEFVCYTHLIHRYGIWDDLRPARRISTLRYLESFYRTNHEMHVVEDNEYLCGYMVHKIINDISFEESIKQEYNEYILNNTGLDKIPENFSSYPSVVASIVTKFPLKVFFCFQPGFKKSHVIEKFCDILINRLKNQQIPGMHVVIDEFEMIEPLLLKKMGFYLHPSDEKLNVQYYVFNLKN